MKNGGLLRRRRDTSRVIYEVLSLTRGKVTKTQIVYKANLNFELGTKYIEFLLARNLLQQSNNARRRKLYQLTEKGKRLLEFMGEVEKELVEPVPLST